ncbi:MAG: hypothetical protein Q7N50_05410 [Armatimonadota bacterium]|nr:hypothetical protein [Armatimonadota bacterium]
MTLTGNQLAIQKLQRNRDERITDVCNRRRAGIITEVDAYTLISSAQRQYAENAGPLLSAS